MGSADGASWNNKRPDFVTLGFQVSTHLVEDHTSVPSKEAANILTEDPFGRNLPYNSKHLRPEVAVIFRASALAGTGERLTGKTSGDNVDWTDVISLEGADVSMNE